MVKEIDCDIFKAPIDILIHGCNINCCFGAGIAAEIAKRFPEAAEVDSKTKKGDLSKLGTFSFASIDYDPNIKYIVNLYQQDLIGHPERSINYEAFYAGLEKVRKRIANYNLIIGIPYGIGCGLAKGSWRVIREMIYDIFEKSPFTVYICKNK